MNTQLISQQLTSKHYFHAVTISGLVNYENNDRLQFQKHWDRLALDENFANYTHRERRLLRYTYQHAKPLEINYDNQYISSVTYNVDYTKGPNELLYVENSFINDPITQKIIETDIHIFERSFIDKQLTYDLNLHLFRVKAADGTISPTTSGIHQDGMDFICMHFINSQNIMPVASNLYKNNKPYSNFYSTCMHNFLETLFVNDKKIYHSAGEVKQNHLAIPAYRDLLLVTFRSINN
ncbi:2OG-Fe dioxygenase family protein [Thiotrichales bacterium 19S3-7]|nr:2OG-Fe dioxygenase family protein [Thiotrichales bacterium 19S3-7]MCF6803040.1 2OG-Fe dioxygenase family protein [Thiotrichales bacterium 19S3-11]